MTIAVFPGTHWFDHVAIRVSQHASHDAPVLATDGSRVKSAVYKITVTHRPTNTRVHLKRTDFDFEKLRDDAKAALDHGHVCQASCPWFFVDLVEHIPKRRLLMPNHASCVVTRHIRLYQELFDHTHAFILSAESQNCAISRDVVPSLLFAFLFHDQDPKVHETLLTPTSPTSVSSSSSSSLRTSPRRSYKLEKRASMSMCRICGDCLVPDDHSMAMHGVTTLQCRHVFHDECILQVLNATMECPLCKEEEDTSSLRTSSSSLSSLAIE
ncbi:Aste57867_13446 [Aphanomyces stellatus]|uniref:Aste57867_13446 protein n=1 Tax=Aphanomyces stellatus TaxID=120398 RepID=A0A485L080_9STRA|nr:hypothetical protein As57867_013396 [Aphanomyces stellatus]VFT90284.1 Aste57867_13446 [Aphanomyces stellatus]